MMDINRPASAEPEQLGKAYPATFQHCVPCITAGTCQRNRACGNAVLKADNARLERLVQLTGAETDGFLPENPEASA